uniref:Uncharacterized protein n=1 Tax=Moniliophthora roreri TaxID=221103 RepID=A0A0W0FBZ9_MONRR
MRAPSEISSLYSSTGTFTTLSTIQGLGSISGRAMKTLGKAVVYGIDSILIRRRLAQIESHLGASTEGDEQSYEDLLEFSRSVYSWTIRKRSLRLIMARIGSMEFQDLATSVVALHSSSDLYLHLSCVLECLWWDNVESDTNTDTLSNDAIGSEAASSNKKRSYYRSTGCDAYLSSLPIQNDNIPDFLLCSPAILYFALVASLGRRDHSRIMVELGMLSFLRELGCFDKRASSVREGSASQLLLRVIAAKLDPVSDYAAYLAVVGCLDEMKDSRLDLQTLEVTSAESDNDIAGLIEDTISFTKSMATPNGDKLFGNSRFRKASVPSTYLFEYVTNGDVGFAETPAGLPSEENLIYQLCHRIVVHLVLYAY